MTFAFRDGVIGWTILLSISGSNIHSGSHNCADGIWLETYR